MQPLVLVITFLAVYQLSNRIKVSPKYCSGIVVSVPFLLDLALRHIYGANISNLIKWHDILTLALLYTAYLFVFHKSQQDDSVVHWIEWGVVGLIIVPVLITWLTSWLILI
jgi:hypothetical protein